MATKMTRAERERFFTTLAHATDERAVQAAYESGLLIFLPKGTVFEYPCKCDGYLNVDMFLRLLLEYKLDKNLEEAPQRAKVLVQLIFYLKQFEEAGIELPNALLYTRPPFADAREELAHLDAILRNDGAKDNWLPFPLAVAEFTRRLPTQPVYDGAKPTGPAAAMFAAMIYLKWTGSAVLPKDCTQTETVAISIGLDTILRPTLEFSPETYWQSQTVTVSGAEGQTLLWKLHPAQPGQTTGARTLP